MSRDHLDNCSASWSLTLASATLDITLDLKLQFWKFFKTLDEL
jgi:hypothetical protein